MSSWAATLPIGVAMTAAAVPEPSVVLDWLRHLYAAVDDGWLSAFALERGTGARYVDWGTVDGLEAFAAVLERRATGCDVWLGVGTRKERLSAGRRGGDADVDLVPALWADIDVAGPGHQVDGLPRDDEHAFEVLRSFPLAPTATVHTGGGLQAWWVLAEPLMPDEAAPLLARWAATWDELGRRAGVHVDNTFDLARVLRVPGTWNRKVDTPRPVVVLEAVWTRQFGADDLLAHTIEAPPLPAQPEVRSVPYIGPERPGDAFNAVRTGSDLLARAGFTLVRRDRNGDEHWARPGKDIRQGASATVYGDDGHTTIWSDTVVATWPALVKNRPYDPFGLYACLFHGGDFPAARERLSSEGYGARPRGGDDLSWIEESKPPAIGLQRAGGIPSALDDWPEPEPIATRRPAEPWPVDVLPPWAADHCEAVAHRLQVPVDLCCQLFIGVMSTICAGRVDVSTGEGWVEPTNTWTATGMRSGTGKSPAEKMIVGPLRRLERELVDRSAHERRKAMVRKRKAKARLDANLKSLDADSPRVSEADVWQAMADFEALPEPVEPRLLADDVTPEKLVQLLAHHDGRMAIVSAEAGLFDMVAGAYGERGRTVNIDVYLKAFSGDALKVDRKGSADRAGVAISIPRPLLTVAVTAQPTVLASLAARPDLLHRGFVPRFMLALPDDLVGRRDVDAMFAPRALDTAEDYETELVRLGHRLWALPTPVVVQLDADALEVFHDWRRSMEQRLGRHGDLDAVNEWVAKLFSTALRLAALLHVADGNPLDRLVDADTMERALTVARYWEVHAVRVLVGLWSDGDAAEEDAQKILDWVLQRGLAQFSLRDAGRHLRRHFVDGGQAYGTKGGERMLEALQLLVDRGWLRVVDGGPVEMRGRGKPSLELDVHPEAFS